MKKILFFSIMKSNFLKIEIFTINNQYSILLLRSRLKNDSINRMGRQQSKNDRSNTSTL